MYELKDSFEDLFCDFDKVVTEFKKIYEPVFVSLNKIFINRYFREILKKRYEKRNGLFR